MVNVKVSGNAIQVLNVMSDKLENLRPMLGRMAAYQERSTKLNFAQQSDPDGAPWAALSASTLLRKRGGAILRSDRPALIHSINSEVSGDSAFAFATQGYGIFHQTGTSKMPQRKFLGFGDRDREEHAKIAKEFLSTI